MINRYEDISLLKTADGKLYQKGTRYPFIPYGEEDIYLFVGEGDRLTTLANRYYLDPGKYFFILAANPQITRTLMHPTPGTQIRIPLPLDRVQQLFTQINNG
jgi:hypothetical protein